MIGAVIAMESEAKILLDILQVERKEEVSGKPVFVGKAAGEEVALILCGIGKVNAAIGAQILLDKFGADKLLNFGVAGSILDGTEVKEVYLISHAVEYDFDLSELNHTKIGTPNELDYNLLPLKVPSLPLPIRVLATGDRFNDSPVDHDLIQNYMQAQVRDMEGAAIARTGLHAKVPVTIVKAISDKYGSNSSFEQYHSNMLGALENLQKHLPAVLKEMNKAE